MARGYRPELDRLRAIAILMVVAFHCGLPPFSAAYRGVDVFFTLSGYVITRVLLTEVLDTAAPSVVAFYARRARRILPALMMVVVVALALSPLLLHPFGAQQSLAKTALATVLLVPNLFLWREAGDYFGAGLHQNLLAHTWSLGVEEQCYLVWPLAVYGVARAGKADLCVPRIAGLCAAGALASIGYSAFLSVHDPVSAFYLPGARFWEFALGGLLQVGHAANLPAPRAAPGSALFGMALLALASVSDLGLGTAPWPGALPAVLGTLLVLAHDPGGAGTARVEGVVSRALVAVGRWSYSWYLWQGLAISAIAAWQLQKPGPVASLVAAAAALMVAAASHRWIETPFRHPPEASRQGAGRTLVAAATASAAVGIAAIAGGAWATRSGALHSAYAPVAEAAADVHPLTVRCHLGPAFDVLPDAVDCTGGAADASTRVLLWGDSHAAHLMPLLDVFGREARVAVRLRSFSACAPKAPIGGTYPGAVADPCARFNASVLQEIDSFAPDELTGVVLAARWWVRLAPTDGSADPAGTPDWSSLRDVASKLNDRGLRVLIVHDTPEWPYVLPLCLARRTESECSEAVLPERPWRADSVARIERLAGAAPLLRTLDLVPALCPNGRCTARVAGRVAYVDFQHLTASASASLLDAARPRLRWLVGTPD